jgi:hypothetical protein
VRSVANSASQTRVHALMASRTVARGSWPSFETAAFAASSG